MAQLGSLFDEMWKDYLKLNPQAQKIVDLLEAEGEKVINDHIALRTFNLPEVTIDVLAQPFLKLGYEYKGDYHFEEKKLYAKHYEHSDPMKPKVFISELLLEKFSDEFQKTIKEKVSSVPASTYADDFLVVKGRPWDLSSSEYNKLKEESDYGAWVAALGYRPNHFTIFINALTKLNEIRELNQFLKDKGIELNSSGGEIKGSKDVYLEQSSTLANNVEVEFTDKTMTIPSCYFEFAKRYPLADGTLYQGFVAKSADKIFESTNKGQ